MDPHLEDDDADAAAMAEAMGFTGFGSQRPAKRKFNANADAAVSSSGEKKKGAGNVSKTGANNAPLGVRRPLQLPPPSSSLPARPGDPVVAGGSGHAEEIDLGEDEDAGGGGDLDAPAFEAKNRLLDALQTPGGYQSEDADSMVAQPPARTVVDIGPPGLPARPSHPQSFQRGQQQHHQHPSGSGGRNGGRDVRPIGETGAPWWEGYYDTRMNENPWERLEKERGLQPRGTWIARNGGVIAGTPSGQAAAAVQEDGKGETEGPMENVVDTAVAAADLLAEEP